MENAFLLIVFSSKCRGRVLIAPVSQRLNFAGMRLASLDLTFTYQHDKNAER